MTKCFPWGKFNFWHEKYISFSFCLQKHLCVSAYGAGAEMAWMRGRGKNEEWRWEFLMDKNEKLSVAWINETVHFFLFAALSLYLDSAGSRRKLEGKLYCCVYFWLKRWNKEKHTTIECLSALTRNCGRRDRKRYIYEILKNILFGSSGGRWRRNERLLDLYTQQKTEEERRSSEDKKNFPR